MRTFYYVLAATGMIVVAAGMAKANSEHVSQSDRQIVHLSVPAK